MKPQPPQDQDQAELFRNRLDNQINMAHELVRLSALIDWHVFDARFGQLYHADKGCPGKSTRLMVGLLYLKHVYQMSDELLVERWLENVSVFFVAQFFGGLFTKNGGFQVPITVLVR